MTACSTDFTNTFRFLATVSRDPSKDESDIIEKLVSLSAPLEHKTIQCRPKYGAASLLKIKDILDTNPQILTLFGMDPAAARREIDTFEIAKSLKSMKPDELSSKNREEWRSWIASYKQVLSELDSTVTD